MSKLPQQNENDCYNLSRATILKLNEFHENERENVREFATATKIIVPKYKQTLKELLTIVKFEYFLKTKPSFVRSNGNTNILHNLINFLRNASWRRRRRAHVLGVGHPASSVLNNHWLSRMRGRNTFRARAPCLCKLSKEARHVSLWRVSATAKIWNQNKNNVMRDCPALKLTRSRLGRTDF